MPLQPPQARAPPRPRRQHAAGRLTPDMKQPRPSATGAGTRTGLVYQARGSR
ncbi:hypothetical protein STXM2123_5485 [Streptomyces sp. F-3]|nr:hypothetical protein STXM2123_5485 [Streptomyces sp. F-3]